MTITEIHMSTYNRLPDQITEMVAIWRIRHGEMTLIEDEPETREYKSWPQPYEAPISEIARSVMAATTANEPENEKALRGIQS